MRFLPPPIKSADLKHKSQTKSFPKLLIATAIAAVFSSAHAVTFEVTTDIGSGYYAGITDPETDFPEDVNIVMPSAPATEWVGAYGIRATNGRSQTIQGKLSIDMQTDSDHMIWGLEMSNKTVLTVEGNTSLTLSNRDQQMVVALIRANSKVDLSAGTTTVNVSTGKGRLMGFEVAGELTLGKTVMNLNLTDVATSSTRWVQAIYSAGGETRATDDVTINVKGDSTSDSDDSHTSIRVINLEGSAYSTNADFEKNLSINVDANVGNAYGVYVSGDTQSDEDLHAGLTVGGTLSVDILGSSSIVRGVYAQGESGVQANQIQVTIESANNEASVTGLYSTANPTSYPGPGRIVVDNGAYVSLSGQGEQTGILSHGEYNNRSSIVVLGGSSTISVTSENGSATGIKVTEGATGAFNNVTTTVTSNGTDEGIRSVALELDSGTVTLSGTNTFAASGTNATALSASASDITLSGAATFTGDKAIEADSSTLISVTQGTITANGTVNNQGKVTLDGATFAVNGKVDSESTLGNISTVGDQLSNVSVGAGAYTITSFSGVNKNLIFNNLAATKRVDVQSNSGMLTAVASGVSNDQFTNASSVAEAIADVLHIGSGDDVGLVVEEGIINDGLTATLKGDNTLANVVVRKNSNIDGLGSITALGLLQWRHEMSNLTKRLGELRDSPQGVGVWARLYGSEQEYGAQSVTSKSTSIQIGADMDIGAGWIMGAALVYTNGDGSYDAGSADYDSFGGAIYGTWLAENGLFIDIIGKYSRLDTDFNAGAFEGNYKNNAFSLSAEAGWHCRITDLFFVEPQAEFTWGRVSGDTFSAGNDVQIDQDNYDSFIGRIGIRTGFHFPDNKGSIYARVSGLYDFDGETRATALRGSARNTVEDDLGGAWVEFGVGANFNWTNNTYTYVDLEKNAGGEVKENWRWNVGVRHVF